jgi:HSP20 family protein
MTSLIPWRKSRTNTNALSRIDEPFRGLHGEMDRLFDSLFGRWPAMFDGGLMPATWGLDIRETEDQLSVRLEAPGFEAEEFEVQVSGEQLQVVAEHAVKDGDREVTERSFRRVLTLPAEIDAENVTAAYKSGVLEIRLAKTEKAKWKKVTVKTS